MVQCEAWFHAHVPLALTAVKSANVCDLEEIPSSASSATREVRKKTNFLTFGELECFANLVRTNDLCPHILNDSPGTLYQLTIRGELTFCDVQIVFETNSNIASPKH